MIFVTLQKYDGLAAFLTLNKRLKPHITLPMLYRQLLSFLLNRLIFLGNGTGIDDLGHATSIKPLIIPINPMLNFPSFHWLLLWTHHITFIPCRQQQSCLGHLGPVSKFLPFRREMARRLRLRNEGLGVDHLITFLSCLSISIQVDNLLRRCIPQCQILDTLFIVGWCWDVAVKQGSLGEGPLLIRILLVHSRALL